MALPLTAGAFGDALFVVLDEVGGDRFNPVWVAQDDAHLGGGFFAFFDLVVAGSGLGTFLVVLFDLLEFVVVEHDFGGATLVDDANGNFVLDRFGHGVAIDDGAEDFEGAVNGGAGEADVGGVGQGVVEVFGEAVGAFDAFLGDAHFLVEVDLAAVGFVGDADDIAAIAQQFRVFGEFVDGGEEDAAAGAVFE